MFAGIKGTKCQVLRTRGARSERARGQAAFAACGSGGPHARSDQPRTDTQAKPQTHYEKHRPVSVPKTEMLLFLLAPKEMQGGLDSGEDRDS